MCVNSTCMYQLCYQPSKSCLLKDYLHQEHVLTSVGNLVTNIPHTLHLYIMAVKHGTTILSPNANINTFFICLFDINIGFP